MTAPENIGLLLQRIVSRASARTAGLGRAG